MITIKSIRYAVRKWKNEFFDPCKWGRHDNVVVRKGFCKINVATLFWGTYRDVGKVVVTQCSRCGIRDGYIEASGIRQSYDPDYLEYSLNHAGS